MTMFFLALKVGALIGSIILPLNGPKKKKTVKLPEISSLCVNENGYLEYLIKPLVGEATKY